MELSLLHSLDSEEEFLGSAQAFAYRRKLEWNKVFRSVQSLSLEDSAIAALHIAAIRLLDTQALDNKVLGAEQVDYRLGESFKKNLELLVQEVNSHFSDSTLVFPTGLHSAVRKVLSTLLAQLDFEPLTVSCIAPGVWLRFQFLIDFFLNSPVSVSVREAKNFFAEPLSDVEKLTMDSHPDGACYAFKDLNEPGLSKFIKDRPAAVFRNYPQCPELSAPAVRVIIEAEIGGTKHKFPAFGNFTHRLAVTNRLVLNGLVRMLYLGEHLRCKIPSLAAGVTLRLKDSTVNPVEAVYQKLSGQLIRSEPNSLSKKMQAAFRAYGWDQGCSKAKITFPTNDKFSAYWATCANKTGTSLCQLAVAYVNAPEAELEFEDETSSVSDKSSVKSNSKVSKPKKKKPQKPERTPPKRTTTKDKPQKNKVPDDLFEDDEIVEELRPEKAQKKKTPKKRPVQNKQGADERRPPKPVRPAQSGGPVSRGKKSTRSEKKKAVAVYTYESD